ncbi:SIR2 family protein [Bacillus sp. WLY-B-L8]|uniref:SIR2 family protein n=1 Tax=Bacillus multifaciens TaxID=3068506 RepID=UPI002740D31F|nr:SIR2 family protein [Bacillus sp. WLY-B-L8]MDP7977664.1 SIR2 family protein [Bacillus sp. WLY-B-L8]
MDDSLKDQFYREVQSFFSSNTVLVVGSGLSCAEGLPGMWGLAAELIKKVPEELQENSQKKWDNIKNDLLNNEGLIKDDANLEATLLKYPPNEDIEVAIRKITTNYIKEEERQVIHKTIIGEKRLRFSSFIKRFRIPETGLVVICTNYDRLIEIACEVEGIPVDNLFYGKNISELNEKKSQMSFCERIERNGKIVRKVFTKKVLIYKPHGCLNWYWSNGKPINSAFDLNIERLIITPGANKYRNGYDTPFDIHRAKANSAIDTASKFIIIGYGFNDEHLETHLKQRILNGIPTLVLTRSLSDNTKKIIEGKGNIIALSYFKSEEISGTEILYKNNIYRINGVHLWDIEKLNEAVF